MESRWENWNGLAWRVEGSGETLLLPQLSERRVQWGGFLLLPESITDQENYWKHSSWPPLMPTLLCGAKYVGFGKKENFPPRSNRVRFSSDPMVHSDPVWYNQVSMTPRSSQLWQEFLVGAHHPPTHGVSMGSHRDQHKQRAESSLALHGGGQHRQHRSVPPLWLIRVWGHSVKDTHALNLLVHWHSHILKHLEWYDIL